MPAARGTQAPLPQQHAASLQQVAALQQVCASVAWPAMQIWQPAQAACLHQTEALAVALCMLKCDGFVLRSRCCCQMPAVKCLLSNACQPLDSEAAYLTGMSGHCWCSTSSTSRPSRAGRKESSQRKTEPVLPVP